ncbi:MAG: hypothetical protein LC749_07980, partial [Actinobacteria bacterium]|nr:hypothetical protein [Actinomycetota bacterium]
LGSLRRHGRGVAEGVTGLTCLGRLPGVELGVSSPDRMLTRSSGLDELPVWADAGTLWRVKAPRRPVPTEPRSRVANICSYEAKRHVVLQRYRAEARPARLALVAADDPLRLRLKLDGPLVEDHRLPLSELLRICGQLRASLRDVAVVLLRHGPSGRAGRVKRVVEESVDLRVVGSPRAGSFALELEAPREAPPEQEELPTDLGPALSEQAVVAFVEGLELLSDESDHLPPGFDRGVLKAIVPFRTALRKGLTEIALDATSKAGDRRATITNERIDIAERLIKRPVKAAAAAEGVLQMVDFSSLEFRLDRPPAPSVRVYFEEKDRDRVYHAIRQYVRVTGEGQFEPEVSEPSKIWASSIEVLYEALPLDPNAFWDEKDIDRLAAEQGAREYELTEDLESDPWRDDDQAAALIEAIRSLD